MMQRVTRRGFLKSSTAAGLAFGLSQSVGSARSASPNSDVRLAIVGLGGIDVPGSVGGRGRQLIQAFRKVPGARITALCDVDSSILDNGVSIMKKAGTSVATYADIRDLLDDKNVDAVVVAAPNHWHALAAVWACQAGKDVYVEKPLAYNIWEGRQIVAAAKKYNRIVQVGTQRRSNPALREAVEFLRSGQIGKPRCGHVVIDRPRSSIGKVAEPTPVPANVNYDLWSGPAPIKPVHRKHLHYEWHWIWTYGNGEIGNNGPHYLDVCRWLLGVPKPPRHALSVGGRFLFDDDGETPNANIALFDCESASILCEVRGLPATKGKKPAGVFPELRSGVLVRCEGGYLKTNLGDVQIFDRQDKEIKTFAGSKAGDMVVAHAANFIEAVRSRDAGHLHAPALEGHLSTACSHIANTSYRLGAQSPPEAIRETIKKVSPSAGVSQEFSDMFERYQAYLASDGVEDNVAPGGLGAWVTLDPSSEQFVGDFADQANTIATRQYREPFVVPAVT